MTPTDRVASDRVREADDDLVLAMHSHACSLLNSPRLAHDWEVFDNHVRRVIAAVRAECGAELQRLTLEVEQEKNTFYCPKCGSCGILECCGFRCQYEQEHRDAYLDANAEVGRLEAEVERLTAECGADTARVEVTEAMVQAAINTKPCEKHTGYFDPDLDLSMCPDCVRIALVAAIAEASRD